ncbi:MAG: hypothetical protein MZV70_50615 [Desulfobacterales bacterium]|nr:hypothetical protein [Desulfobacterales bacterium]
MACAVPVISTTGGALPEVVGDAGLLVPPADPPPWRPRSASCWTTRSTARELGLARARSGCSRHFTWRRAAERTVSVYREAIDGHRRLRPA